MIRLTCGMCTIASIRCLHACVGVLVSCQATILALNSVAAARPPARVFETALVLFASRTPHGVDAGRSEPRATCNMPSMTCAHQPMACVDLQVPVLKMQSVWLRQVIGHVVKVATRAHRHALLDWTIMHA